ncbi:hypothetical protein H9Q09_10050 [Aurantimonas sp. DM33-3]|uniref:hypothetical protein n=1 Tax=Aurantimonas sp. DM33-3 TaxID=2766955 RepID=UPI001651CDBC|nr:hypothetical protein [Aurantimonas sp. DM33-3]MBC6716547.1 hypothetical protein [Aurantimonas sp. DM33-3]
MTRTDAELEAIIMARTADILCQQLSVVDGVCRVEIYDPPGADDENWAVSLTASPERVEGEFYSKGGARGIVVSNPVDAHAARDDYERFLRDPASWSRELWAEFAKFDGVRWVIFGETLKMLRA